jgi:hypothetical protein
VFEQMEEKSGEEAMNKKENLDVCSSVYFGYVR